MKFWHLLRRNRNILWLLLALLTVLWVWRDPAVWATSLAKPQRQTVPLTPPATWTPTSPGVTPGPTRSRPKPTRRAIPSQEAEPWLELVLSPTIGGPGSAVAATIVLENLGGAPLTGAQVTLPGSPILEYLFARASSGQVRLMGNQLLWQPDAVEGGERHELQINLVVSEDALPDTTLLMQATVTWPGGEASSNEVTLILPWALLPETGM